MENKFKQDLKKLRELDKKQSISFEKHKKDWDEYYYLLQELQPKAIKFVQKEIDFKLNLQPKGNRGWKENVVYHRVYLDEYWIKLQEYRYKKRGDYCYNSKTIKMWRVKDLLNLKE